MAKNFIRRLSQILIPLLMPFFILMGVVIIVFRPWYISFEYNQSSFPADPYGMTKEERLSYGTDSLRYITNGSLNDTFLSSMKWPDGTLFYNDREVSHMKDVKNVFQKCRSIWFGILALFIIFMILTDIRSSPSLFFSSLKRGTYLTIGLLFLILILSLFTFDQLFTAFHTLFFQDGTWLFYESDSLIRLYPEKLWVDAFLLCGFLAILFSGFLLLLTKSAENKMLIPNRRRSKSSKHIFG